MNTKNLFKRITLSVAGLATLGVVSACGSSQPVSYSPGASSSSTNSSCPMVSPGRAIHATLQIEGNAQAGFHFYYLTPQGNKIIADAKLGRPTPAIVQSFSQHSYHTHVDYIPNSGHLDSTGNCVGTTWLGPVTTTGSCISPLSNPALQTLICQDDSKPTSS